MQEKFLKIIIVTILITAIIISSIIAISYYQSQQAQLKIQQEELKTQQQAQQQQQEEQQQQQQEQQQQEQQEQQQQALANPIIEFTSYPSSIITNSPFNLAISTTNIIGYYNDIQCNIVLSSNGDTETWGPISMTTSNTLTESLTVPQNFYQELGAPTTILGITVSQGNSGPFTCTLSAQLDSNGNQITSCSVQIELLNSTQ